MGDQMGIIDLLPVAEKSVKLFDDKLHLLEGDRCPHDNPWLPSEPVCILDGQVDIQNLYLSTKGSLLFSMTEKMKDSICLIKNRRESSIAILSRCLIDEFAYLIVLLYSEDKNNDELKFHLFNFLLQGHNQNKSSNSSFYKKIMNLQDDEINKKLEGFQQNIDVLEALLGKEGWKDKIWILKYSAEARKRAWALLKAQTPSSENDWSILEPLVKGANNEVHHNRIKCRANRNVDNVQFEYDTEYLPEFLSMVWVYLKALHETDKIFGGKLRKQINSLCEEFNACTLSKSCVARRIISKRSSTENKGSLLGFFATPTSKLPNKLEHLSIRLIWPKVRQSNDPGYNAGAI